MNEPRAPEKPGTESFGEQAADGASGWLDDAVLPPEEAEQPPERPPRKPKLKKLRLFLVFGGVGILAFISTIFGMMMAVASDVPSLENAAQLRVATNSVLYADDGKGTKLASLTGFENRVFAKETEISPNMRNAVIAVEDKRFYEHKGVDFRGIGRALVQDVLSKRASQGASTITQQFVKNVLEAQQKRTVFQKLREAAVAYHLERKWTKNKILTQYLNTVYFGNGAYGIEAAARTYFGGGGDVYNPDAPRKAQSLQPWQAAYLAGMIASPSGYDPVQHPQAAHLRANLVLRRMLEQGMISRASYQQQKNFYVGKVEPPRPDSKVPYYSSWVTQQLLDRYKSTGLVFGGGLKVTTTLDPDLQGAAEQAIIGRLPAGGPTASLVAIENKTGEVKAMIGGFDFQNRPFNLATNGHRQPGSSFKPFTLIGALEKGISPNRTFVSGPKQFPVPNSKNEKFVVHNYEDNYSGVISLAGATTVSDNSVFAEVGVNLVGTNKIARVAHEMGIRTPLSRNPAMTLGGLKEGVTPLEMAYAYSTLANDGKRVYGSMSPSGLAPVAIERVKRHNDDVLDENKKRTKQVIPYDIAQQAKSILAGVVTSGTGKAAQIGEFAAGKTGTTENYGDAWFVGFNKELTVAVWVGYPDKLKPMETEYGGRPVAGGTFPAEIWHDFMTSWIKLRDDRLAAKAIKEGKEPPVTSQTAPAASTQAAPSQETPAGPTEDQTGGGTQAPSQQKAPAPEEPETPATEEQPPAQEPAPDPGDGDGTGGGAPPPAATQTPGAATDTG